MARQQLPPQINKISLASGKIRYELIVDVGKHPTSGKRAQFRKRYKTEDEAKAKLAELGHEVDKGVYVPQSDLTVETACAEWLAGKRIRRTTHAAYTYALQPLRDRHGSLPVQKLNKKHLDDLVTDLIAGMAATEKGMAATGSGDRDRDPWGPQTVNPMLRHIESVLDSLVAEGKLVRNVASLVDRMAGTKFNSKTFTQAQMRTLLDTADRDRNGHAWHLALMGLRRGEIGGLRWCDVDLQARTLTIANNLVSAGGEATEWLPKTERSARTLPLTDTLVRVLEKAHTRQHAEKLALGNAYGPGTHVVCDPAGRSYHPDTLTDYWIDMCHTAGVPRIRLHDARHTCGTLMHLQKVPTAVISEWLGHTDSAFTMRRYVHSQDDALRAAAKTWNTVVTTRDNSQSQSRRRKRCNGRKTAG